jgi:hypothetical protein
MELPTIQDFTCTSNPKDDLDGFTAWEHFGGLTLDEADRKFNENAEFYQEDFMFMGGRAFAFYYSVLDRYIREVESKNEFADETWIIAHCIVIHVPDGRMTAKTLWRKIAGICDCLIRGRQNTQSDKFFTHLSDDPTIAAKIYERIIDLCRFVIEGVNNIDAASDLERTWPTDKVEEAWTELLEKMLAASGQ